MNDEDHQAVEQLRPTFLERSNVVIRIRIARPEAPSEPVSAANRDGLAVCNHIELPGLAKPENHVEIETLFDEGRETRSLGFAVPSSGTVVDFDIHFTSGLIARQHPRASDYRPFNSLTGTGTKCGTSRPPSLH